MARLQISADAAEYIRKVLLGSEADGLVVAVIPELIDDTDGAKVLGEKGTEASLETRIEEAKARFENLPRKVWVNWIIGAAERERFPSTDIHKIDGVELFWPSDTSEAIGERSLVMKGGQLSFEPPIPPFQLDKYPSP